MSLSREEIIRMALEFGWSYYDEYKFNIDELQEFVDAICSAQREADAVVCEDSKSLIWNLSDDAIKSAGNNVCDNLAATIRARGDK